jgi:Zn-dependent M32 family carboxypeptidase
MDDTSGNQGSTATGWNLFLFAVAISMVAVNWGFLRPAARQIEAMRQHITTLEKTVQVLSKQYGSAHKAMNLMEVLAQQGRECDGASDSLARISDLHDRLVAESRGLEAAHRAIADFTSMRDHLARNNKLTQEVVNALILNNRLHERLIATASQSEAAEAGLEQLTSLRNQLLQAVRSMEDTQPIVGEFDKLQNRLLNMAPITKQAIGVTDELLSMNETLAYDMSLIGPAKSTLSQMVEIHEMLNRETTDVEVSHQALDELVQLKNDVIATSNDTPKAIEALEQTVDLHAQFVEASRSFEQIRRWMSEVILMEPTIQRAVRTLEPITQLGTLRRMTHREIEYAAHMVRSLREQTSNSTSDVENDLPEMASKPSTETSGTQ